MKKDYSIIMYDAKKMFPLSESGYVVQKVKFPTWNRGSQIIWSKSFDTEAEAKTFQKKKLKGVL